MTEIQKTYREVLKEISGKDWQKDHKSRISCAGIALALSVVDDGNLKLSHLRERLVDFSQTEIRTALASLKRSNYFEKAQGGYKLVIDGDTKVDDPIFWALLGAVAQGWIERTN